VRRGTLALIVLLFVLIVVAAFFAGELNVRREPRPAPTPTARAS
jgi:hypothetical protein